MRTRVHWLFAAAVAATLGGCATTPTTKVAEAPPAKMAADVPYLWTLGNAPQAHKDMVAEFGKVGLKPGRILLGG